MESLPEVEGDPLQLQQVIQALVDNAREAIGENKGLIDITSDIQDMDSATIWQSFPNQQLMPGPHVVLEVADTGCGIPPEILPLIFDPFFSTKFAGRGLSLSVVQGILQAHKAGFSVASTVGSGTSFKIFIPVVSTACLTPEPFTSLAIRPQGTVLFVDDEPMLRETAAEILETAGYNVITAQDGLEAVDLYKERQHEIALVILDLTMPRMDGKTALRAILAQNPEAKIILSSGYTEDEVTQLFMGTGLAGFLSKPYRMTQLESLVSRFVRLK